MIDCKALIDTGDCLTMLFTWLYYRKRGGTEIQSLEAEAKMLNNSSMERYWLFVYEVLNDTELNDDWKTMKKKGVSFIMNGI